MPLQESLERAGHRVSWNQAEAGSHEIPAGVDLVILNGESESIPLKIDSWRKLDPPPAILLLSRSAASRELAISLRVPEVANTASSEELQAAVRSAIAKRFTVHLSGSFARGLLQLGTPTSPLGDAEKILFASRTMALAYVRESLRWSSDDYVCATELVSAMRKQRMLTIPEVEIVRSLDGTSTVKTLVSAKSGDGSAAGKLLWALLSCGAAKATPEPPNSNTPRRMAILEARKHLAARECRLQHATHYDVLEVDRDASADQVDLNARTLALRYSLETLQVLDLGDQTHSVESNWQQILLARKVLMNRVDKANYDDWMDNQEGRLRSPWAFEITDPDAAWAAFQRGQVALVDGEHFSAVSCFAAACRAHPDNADYETYLCWAKFRAGIARGDAPEELIASCLRDATSALRGRRPWPRALVALALLCAADGDSASARFHLEEALSVDPNLSAAKELLARINRESDKM